MELVSFENLDLRPMLLDTVHGDIIGLYTEYRPDFKTVPDGLIPYGLRHGDDDDSFPVTIEPSVVVNYFGTIFLSTPVDFKDKDHLVLIEWGILDEDDEDIPDWATKYIPQE